MPHVRYTEDVPTHGRFDTPLEATLTGIKDLFGRQALEDALTDDMRIDGQTCLVTGASSGLGFAIAVELAQRGGRVIMVSRSGIPDKGDEVRRLSGSRQVEQIRCDLSDLDDVHRLADALRGERIDVVVENAGVASPRAKRTPQGLEAMFVTNYLSKFLLLNRLLRDGTVRNATFGHPRETEAPTPRIVFISSDSHQGASAIDWSELGEYRPFDVNKAINNYSYFKLVLNTFAVELSRRLADGDGGPDVAVHAMCPGPVDTNIIRDAPQLFRLLMKVVFKVFFRAPDVAAKPSVFMCVAPRFAETTGEYLHMFNEKRMDSKVYDRDEGERLWEHSVALLDEAGSWPYAEATAA
ncbi:MAG TPA: SDR family NAD(P)-dependent oxidoreductase [Polyangiaceae bacterium]|nr:SDR family NAD(P)-dependent oxidoreductase [Polyangiaceae bacterium]